MNNTGVVRRIDDLGRVVIPKDIRRHLRLQAGDALDISLNDDTILFSKHSYIDSNLKEAKRGCYCN